MKQCEAPSEARARGCARAWAGHLRREQDSHEEWKKPRNCVDESFVSAELLLAHRRKQLHCKSAFSTGVALIALHRRSEGASFKRRPHPWELQESRTILVCYKGSCHINFSGRTRRFAQLDETFVRKIFIDGRFRNFADNAASNICLANCIYCQYLHIEMFLATEMNKKIHLMQILQTI